MNLPNRLTFSRLLMTPFAVALLFLKDYIPYNFLISSILFLLAMFTDILDGIIARKFHLITKLGAFLDPLADKLILILYFIFLQNYGIYPLWLLLVFFGREMIVDGFRSFAVSQNVYVGAIKSGKLKALFQTFSIVLGLSFVCIENNQFFGINMDSQILEYGAFYSMLIALIISLIGMVILLKNNLALLKK